MRKLRKGDSYGFCFHTKPIPYRHNYRPTDPRLIALPLALIYLLGYILWSMLKHILSRPYSRLSLTILISIFCCCAANGQEGSPQSIKPIIVGWKVPAEFWTREHLFYHNGDTMRKSLAEYKGKMLILDFWMSGCSQCILHQREINHFKELYKDELAVIMVNSLSTKEDYAKIDKYLKGPYFTSLGIPQISSIIHDDYLQELLAPRAYPSYFWINRLGYLQLFTFRNLLDRDFVAPFIKKSS